LGHEDIVRRASRLFDQVIIAVAEAHHKKTMFNLEERKTMTKEALKDCPNVVVESFTGLVSDFALAKGAQTMVRGVRSMTDFEYEFQLAGMNRRLVSHIDTVFLNTVDVYQCISSTLVREIAVLGGDVAQFVSPGVYARLQSKKA